MSKLDDALSAFKRLSADEIAEVIKKRHIKGRMGTTYNCPMALLLKGNQTGSFVIGRRYIVRQSGKTIEKVRTPNNIATMIRKFDIGGYPELIAPPPRCIHKASDTPRKRSGKHIAPRKRRREIKNHLRKLVSRFEE